MSSFQGVLIRGVPLDQRLTVYLTLCVHAGSVVEGGKET